MANKQQTQEPGDDWLTKAQAMDILNIKERTLDRMVERNEIQRLYKPLPGRRPLPMFHPGDVERAAQQAADAGQFVMTNTGTRGMESTSPPVQQVESLVDALPALAEFVSAVRGQGQELRAGKTYVELDEATEISGLPRAFLLREAALGTIPAKKFGKWYFQRKALQEM